MINPQNIKIGDEVSVLNDTETGIIIKIIGENATFEDKNGFLHTLPLRNLVPRNKDLYNHISKIPPKETKKIIHPKKDLKTIDLHIDKITDKADEISPSEKLFLQKETLISGLERAQKNGIKKLEIIHGLGDGTLQNMVYEVLQNQINIDFHNKEILHHQSASIIVYFQ